MSKRKHKRAKPKREPKPTDTTATATTTTTTTTTTTSATTRTTMKTDPGPRWSIARAPYVLARFFHNVVDAALLPLAVYYWVSSPDAPSGFSRGVVGALSFVMALFVVVLPQADYPTTLRGALVRTAPLVANIGAAMWASGKDVALAAYWSTSALVAALGVTFLAMTVLGVRRARAEGGATPGMIAFIVGFFGGCGVLACVVAIAMLRPIYVPLIEWSAAQWVASFTWIAHAGGAVSAWVAMSIFSTYLESDQSRARQSAYERWVPVAALLLIASQLVVIFELGSDSTEDAAEEVPE